MSSINATENCGLLHLVEAATALTQLVSRVPSSRASSGSGPANGQLLDAHAISDDEDSKKDTEMKRSKMSASAESSVSNAGSTPATGSLGEKSPKSSPMVSEKPVAPPTSSTPPTGNPCPREIFPQRLMRILSDSSITDIITWLPHGRSFVIVQPEVLAEKILPAYFPESCTTALGSTSSSCKYPSFTRKLNRWGFRQVTRGPDAGAFHHKYFRRDDPSQCRQMICQRSRRRKVDENRNAVILPRGIIPRTVTASAELGMPSNNSFTTPGIKGRPLPTVHNYRTKSPPTASVTSTNVSSNIISNTASPAQQVESYQGPLGTHPTRAPDSSIANDSVQRAPNPAVPTLQQQQLDAHALLQRNLAILKQQQQQSQAPVGAPRPPSTAPSPPVLPSLYNAHQQAAAASLLAPLLQQAQAAHQPNLAFMLHQHAANVHAQAQAQANRSSPTQLNMQQPTQVFSPPSAAVAAPVSAQVATPAGTNATTTSPPPTSLAKAPTPSAPATATTDTTMNPTKAVVGKDEKSEAELRIENAKTMLYNAYLKALG